MVSESRDLQKHSPKYIFIPDLEEVECEYVDRYLRSELLIEVWISYGSEEVDSDILGGNFGNHVLFMLGIKMQGPAQKTAIIILN